MRGGFIIGCCVILSSLILAETSGQSKSPTAQFPDRKEWKASRIHGSPDPELPYRLERVFPQVDLDQPVALTNAPGSDRMFVVELNGLISSIPLDRSFDQPDLMLDMKSAIPRMRQVYGLTFHPNWKENREVFLCYVLEADLPAGTILSRFRLTKTDPPRIDPKSEEILLTWLSGGHNGGCLKFGPDGYLYVSTGDGGPAFPPDPLMAGQDIGNVLSSILRIDINRKDPGLRYGIPKDNPFVDKPYVRPEIWAYGLRNPWKMSFDSKSGDLWVGDVGWELWELVYKIKRGGNYGWSLVEGRQPVHEERPRGPTPILPPIVDHPHTEARSVTGGFVYRGRELSGLIGSYVYGDYITGKLWSIAADSTSAANPKELANSSIRIICFAVDNNDELYVVDHGGGIYRLVENDNAGKQSSFPRRLSKTGLFRSLKTMEPEIGVYPYQINAEPWEDGARADRWIALPNDSQLDVHDRTDLQRAMLKGEFKYPEGAVLVKNISFGVGDKPRRNLETQLLHFDGLWHAYSYLWNDEGSDAILSDGTAFDREIVMDDSDSPTGTRTQAYHFAGRTECQMCHTPHSGVVQGFRVGQLFRNHDYGQGEVDQLAALDHMNFFVRPLPKNKEAMPEPGDERADLAARARSYLHVNCAHCHRRGGGGSAAVLLDFKHSLKGTGLLNTRPTKGTFGIHRAEILAAGEPYRSVMYYRMAKEGRGRMPHLGSREVDEIGLKLIADWIRSVRPDSEATSLAVNQPVGSEELKARMDHVSGAMALRDGLSQTKPERRAKILELALGAPPEIRDLFEKFLPKDQRSKRLGTSVDLKEILALDGNVVRGRSLFHESKVTQCRNCHKVGDQGNEIGPALDEIGKKTPDVILDSLINPSKDIAPQYVSQLIETSNGKVLVGLLVKRTDRSVTIRDARNQNITIPTEEIELMVPQRTSIMPDQQLRDMTAQELSDLLAYLRSLK